MTLFQSLNSFQFEWIEFNDEIRSHNFSAVSIKTRWQQQNQAKKYLKKSSNNNWIKEYGFRFDLLVVGVVSAFIFRCFVMMGCCKLMWICFFYFLFAKLKCLFKEIPHKYIQKSNFTICKTHVSLCNCVCYMNWQNKQNLGKQYSTGTEQWAKNFNRSIIHRTACSMHWYESSSMNYKVFCTSLLFFEKKAHSNNLSPERLLISVVWVCVCVKMVKMIRVFQHVLFILIIINFQLFAFKLKNVFI